MAESSSELEDIRLKPVGEVHTDATTDQIRSGSGREKAVIEIYRGFEEALDGLEGFSHLFVVSYFHKLRPEQVGPLKVKPRGLIRQGIRVEELPTKGVFALDSPTRPNPIGLSLVRLAKMEERNLHVAGLDLFDGTPVLDIKPYQPQYRVENYGLPRWYKELREKAGHV